MQIKKTGSIIYGANLTAAEKKAMNMEIQRQLAEYDRKNANEIDAMVLWILYAKFDFDLDKLQEFQREFDPTLDALCERYEMTDAGDELWLCTHKLKEIGLDLEE